MLNFNRFEGNQQYQNNNKVDANNASLSNLKNASVANKPAVCDSIFSSEAAVTETPSKGSQPKGTLRVADSMSGISDETRDYLNNNQQFKEFEQEYISLLKFQNKQKALLPEKEAALQAAKRKWDTTPYADTQAKSVAEEAYYKAMKEHDDVEAMIYYAEKDMKDKWSDMDSYAMIINQWKDGEIVTGSRQTVGLVDCESINNKKFKMVTLSDGRKAYESDGKFHALQKDGWPDMDNFIE